MLEHSPLIAAIVVGLVLAFLFGTAAQRLKLPPLVGYLLAGVVVGPFTPGFVADSHLTLQLAEIGVILLMFGVGLHFAPKDLLAVRAVVIPGAMLQLAAASTLGLGVGWLLGWSLQQGLVFGLCLSVASTVVVLRALQDRKLMDSQRGRTIMGWLVVQDLLAVLVLVMLPPLAGLLKGGAIVPMQVIGALALTIGKLGLFTVLMLVIGRKVIPAILHYIAHTGSRELFRLAVLSVALGVAFVAAEFFGVSIALGAFFAGMILSESPLSQRAAEESLPLRDAFAVLFFVSVGMLFNPIVLLRDPMALLLTFAIVLVAGGVVPFLALLLLRQPLRSALFIAPALAQIGEFSFILADLAVGLHLMPARARGLILGTSILSILLNPLLLGLGERLRRRLAPEPDAAAPHGNAAVVLHPTSLTGHLVLVGYGRVGRLIAEQLAGEKLLVIEEAAEAVEKLAGAQIEHFAANAAAGPALAAANLGHARLLLVAIPQSFEAGQIVQQARRANPDLKIVVRAHFEAEVSHLMSLGADSVILGPREIASAMLEFARPGPA